MRWFIQRSACVCSGTTRTLSPNHSQCSDVRTQLSGRVGTEICQKVISFLFELADGSQLPVMNSATVGNVKSADDAGSDDEASVGNVSVDDCLFRFKQNPFTGIVDALDSILEMYNFCLLEPLTLGFFPYHTQADNSSFTSNGRCTVEMPVRRDFPNAECIDEDILELIPKLGTEEVALHDQVIKALREITMCTHERRSLNEWVCGTCIDTLSGLSDTLNLQDAVVGRFVRDVLPCGSRLPVFTRAASRNVATLIERKVTDLKNYLAGLSTNLDKTCVDYWRQFGCSDAKPIVQSNGMTESKSKSKSLCVFPGRAKVSEALTFDKIDKQVCTKVYFKGKTMVPSLLTVQCCCAHPKLIGFLLLKECESIAAKISSVITHFTIPPRRIWYDSSCNDFDSAIRRIPWFMRLTMLVVDRFHLSGHVCSNMFNGNMHRFLDTDRSLAAEVINAIIDKGTSHIAYLKGNNVIPFMKIVFAQINATALVRDHVQRDDLEDDDLIKLFRERCRCYCHLCTSTAVRSHPGEQSDTSNETDMPPIADGIALFSRGNERIEVPSGAMDATVDGEDSDGSGSEYLEKEPDINDSDGDIEKEEKTRNEEDENFNHV